MTDENKTVSGTLPWTKSCFVCGQDNPRGLQLKSRLDDGCVHLEYTTRETDLGWRHLVHGGLAMTLLDEVMTWSAMIAARCPCVAAELTVKLKRPIEVGRLLQVESMVPTEQGKLILTDAKILDTDGNLLAAASGKYVPMPTGGLSLCEDDFVTGPEAIDLAALFDAV